MGKSLALKKPKPWEKYLPAYREGSDATTDIATPSQTQRDFYRLLDDIGTPARRCVPRGRSSGRKKGECTGKKPEQPVIFKLGKRKKTVQKIIIPGFENTPSCSNPQDINELARKTLAALKMFSIVATTLSKKRFDSS